MTDEQTFPVNLDSGGTVDVPLSELQDSYQLKSDLDRQKEVAASQQAAAETISKKAELFTKLEHDLERDPTGTIRCVVANLRSDI